MSFAVNHLIGFGVLSDGAPPYAGVDQIPLMTGYTTSGVTMAASTELTASYLAWYAGDNNFGATEAGFTWIASAATGWLRADFGSERWVYRYSVRHWTNTSVVNRCPRDWTFQGSNDATSWTTLDTQTSQTSWGSAERREYTLSSPQFYRYYRINVSANNGGANLQIGEFEILA